MLFCVLDVKVANLPEPERHLWYLALIRTYWLRFLGRLPKFLLPDLSLLPQFLGDDP
jgi:hypothetical protein